MKQQVSLSKFSAGFLNIFKRYHIVIYTLTVVAGVSVAIFMLNGILSGEAVVADGATSTSTPVFDQETIRRIDNFNTSTSTGDTFSLPSGRINPLAD
ncbi:hypothetical protein B7Z28_01450 [Candidatus Saccharibacteria bacterium 32-45-3]|nr:MAG: hypothetical protein B7Z28_01450 [Candidatus Saccharibacteria bacterium 32-45-3]